MSRCEIDYLLSEIGILKYFDQFEKIIESRQNEYVKKNLTFIAEIFKRAFVEYDQLQKMHYDRIEAYKKDVKFKQEFIYHLCDDLGLDYQLEMTCYLSKLSAIKTLKKYGATENPKTEAA
jgi:hypothetical protein